MNDFKNLIESSYSGYFNYLIQEILHPSWSNYFYGLLIISLAVFLLELFFPWRKNQAVLRKDFWLDLFYMFFNFFFLNLIVLIALSNVTEKLLSDFLLLFNLKLLSLQLFSVATMPKFLSLLLLFIFVDFIQWNIHRLLHKVPFFWNIHKTHHSVTEMGFAAHFRYNWMEPIIYKAFLYIPVAIIGGFSVNDVFIVHFISIAIGHLNHANLNLDYGIFRYILNNPKMHIWHHSKENPIKNGSNFGISLSIWDYIFKTNYIPKDGRDIELGFANDDQFPQNFIQQELYPFQKNN